MKLIKSVYRALVPKNVRQLIWWARNGSEVFHSVENRLSATERRVSATEDKMSATEGRASAAEDRVSVTESRLSTAEDRMSVTESRLSTTVDMLSNYDNSITELEQKYTRLENIQQVSSEQVINIQNKMDKLNELQLDIFIDKPKYHWDFGTFSQSGEDMIISLALPALGIPISEVSYLDLGANHAKMLSNTYHFYKQGARGVLVEANAALIPELKFYRYGDIILNRCIAEHSGHFVDFYVMGTTLESGDAMSTPDKASALEFININPNLKIHTVLSVETITVNDIIENYMGKTPTILSIDIEGNEMKILKSIDFVKYRPFVLIVEMVPYTSPYLVCDRNQEIINFMNAENYYEYAFTGLNSIFIDKEQLAERERLFVQ